MEFVEIIARGVRRVLRIDVSKDTTTGITIPTPFKTRDLPGQEPRWLGVGTVETFELTRVVGVNEDTKT